MSEDDREDGDEIADPVGEILDKGWELLRKNDLDGARAAADEARQLAPKAGEPVTLLGAIAAASGETDTALDLYRRAAKIEPQFVAPLIYAAEIHAFEREDHDEALRLVARALDQAEEEEDFVDALLLKAEICLAKGDTDEAAETIEELPPTQLPDAALEARAGRVYLDLGDLAEAESHFQQAIVLDPKAADAYHGLGMVYEEQNDTRAMVKAWLRVRELDLEDEAVPWTMTQDEFEAIGERALEELPDRIGKLLENVPIVAADYPSIEIVAEGNDPRMLGFFSGVPYPDKSHLGGAPHLDCVFLYKLNIERMAKDRDEATKEVRITLLHETGHFFGLSEEELEEMGLG